MASRVDICNLALSQLGAATITSLTDNTQGAKLCNILYEDAADAVHMEGVWASTIVRASLARTTNTPVYEYSYEYQLPTSPFVLRVLAVNEQDPGTNKYSIEGDKLLTDMSTVSIKYIGRITDTEQYSSVFKEALVSRLVAQLSFPVTGQSTLVAGLWDKYNRDVKKGLAVDGQQGSGQYISSSDLINVR